jgi:hypothetical protein
MKGDLKAINYLLSRDFKPPVGTINRIPAAAEYNDPVEYGDPEANCLSPKERAERAQRAYFRLVRGVGG